MEKFSTQVQKENKHLMEWAIEHTKDMKVKLLNRINIMRKFKGLLLPGELFGLD